MTRPAALPRGAGRCRTTLPNLHLVSNAVTVVRSSGTIVSCSVSLGYDTPHTRIEPLLLEASRAAELEDGFVQVLELGDFAVTYRVAGFLEDVKRLLSVRSQLRVCVLDALHAGGVEIVSPSFMVQRPLPEGARVIPELAAAPVARAAVKSPEELIFDKAEDAESSERLREARRALALEIEALEGRLAGADDRARSRLEGELTERRSRLARMDASLDRAP